MKLKINLLTILLTFLLLMTANKVLAMPDISAGETNFDFFKGCYILRNNVRFVDNGRTMTANRATVQLTSQKVWATGNVTLVQEGIKFRCDKMFLQGAKMNVEVIGNVNFLQDSAVKISSDVGVFSWNSKVADFYGRVKLKTSTVNIDSNLKAESGNIDGIYDHVQYNIVEKKIMALDKHYSAIPKAEFSEADPIEN